MKIVPLLAALWVAAPGAGAQPAVDANSTNLFRLQAGPVLQCPTETSVRITWVTDRNATGTVEYGRANGALKSAFASRHGLIDANTRLHSVLLTGLEPGASYRYRVVSREISKFGAYKVQFGAALTNDFHQFRTLDREKSAFTFLVFNDVHDRAATIPELLQTAGANPPDFIVWNGDLLSYSDTEAPVMAMLKQATESFATSTPLFWIRGNHETRGDFARQLPAYFGLPDGHYYYAFTHGPVRFVVLDTGEDKLDSSVEYSGLVDFSRYRREEAKWLEQEVRGEPFRTARFRVVLCHMPFPVQSNNRPEENSRTNVFRGMSDDWQNFGPTLQAAGIDLMICGHLHRAHIVQPNPARHSYPVVIGGGPLSTNCTVIRVNVSHRDLETIILRPDGTQVDSCTVQPRRGSGANSKLPSPKERLSPVETR